MAAPGLASAALGEQQRRVPCLPVLSPSKLQRAGACVTGKFVASDWCVRMGVPAPESGFVCRDGSQDRHDKTRQGKAEKKRKEETRRD